MSGYKRYSFWLLGLLALGCSEVIDLGVNESGGQLIIYGNVTNIREGNFVTIFRTGVMGSEPVPVLRANVTLIDGDGRSEQFIMADSGRYELAGNVIPRVEGGTYRLEVQIGSKRYETDPQVMPRNYGQDNMSFELTTNKSISTQGANIEESVVNVYNQTDFEALPEEFYLRWDLEEAYTYLGTILPYNHFPRSFQQIQCFVINKLNQQRIFLHNGERNRATTIPAILLESRRVDKSFQSLHYFNLTRSSMTREVYEYWAQLDGIVNRQGGIFDVPPAGVKGNIRAVDSDEEVLGVFEVVSAEITRLPVTRHDIPVNIYDECEFRGWERLRLQSVPPDCRQCLIDEGIVEEHCLTCGILPNSTSSRPYYF